MYVVRSLKRQATNSLTWMLLSGALVLKNYPATSSTLLQHPVQAAPHPILGHLSSLRAWDSTFLCQCGYCWKISFLGKSLVVAEKNEQFNKSNNKYLYIDLGSVNHSFKLTWIRGLRACLVLIEPLNFDTLHCMEWIVTWIFKHKFLQTYYLQHMW